MQWTKRMTEVDLFAVRHVESSSLMLFDDAIVLLQSVYHDGSSNYECMTICGRALRVLIGEVRVGDRIGIYIKHEERNEAPPDCDAGGTLTLGYKSEAFFARMTGVMTQWTTSGFSRSAEALLRGWWSHYHTDPELRLLVARNPR